LSAHRLVVVVVLAALVLMTPGDRLQAGGPPRVLIVGPIDSYGALVAGVSEGLQAGGFADTSAVRVDVRNVRSRDEAKAAIAEAVDRGVDALVTIFTPATQAARDVTTTVPIVFCPVADPLAARLVASLDAPGANITGIASADAEATRQRLLGFTRVVPGLKRLGVFVDPGFPPDRLQLANLRLVGPDQGVIIVAREVLDGPGAVAALEELDRGEVDALFILKEALLRSAGRELGRIAVDRRIPILVGDSELAELRAVVASVGPDQRHVGRLGGAMTAKILKGARPGALPVEHPAFELVLNLGAAKEIGLAVPDEAIRGAARVIR